MTPLREKVILYMYIHDFTCLQLFSEDVVS